MTIRVLSDKFHDLDNYSRVLITLMYLRHFTIII